MSETIHFRWRPNAFVTVALFGLDYPGRILECRYDGSVKYQVIYAKAGELLTADFYEDELAEPLAI